MVIEMVGKVYGRVQLVDTLSHYRERESEREGQLFPTINIVYESFCILT